MERFATAQVMSHGGNDNPAVKAIMAAMFTGEQIALNFSKNAEPVVQSVGSGLATGGIQLG